MDIQTRIILKSKKDQAVRRYHPWVFSNAIKRVDGTPEEGEIVAVYSNKEKLLGYGHYQYFGSISVRMLSFGEEILPEDYCEQRIKRAWSHRQNLGLNRSDNNVFRAVFAEGDGLPGLIADHYNGVVVIQCHSFGMHQQRDLIAKTFMAFEGVTGVYDKSGSTLARYSAAVENGVLAGDIGSGTEALENGHRFAVDWETGQKTGFFIDQRDNRAMLAEFSKDRKVLNTFCYTGGFSIYALGGGAQLVHSLDSSQPALDLVEENVRLNGFEKSNHAVICADAVDYMKDLKEDYDVIVLDPPAFAKSRGARHNAVQGYKRLNAAAIRQIKSGGIIFTFSCSQVVDSDLFYNTIVAAGLAAEREVTVLHTVSQPADHPVSLYHPEGGYLKGLVIQVH